MPELSDVSFKEVVMLNGQRLPPDEPVLECLRDFWDRFSETGDSGEAPWEVLDKLRLQVSDCMAKEPPDFDRAASLTAQAVMLMQGGVY